jgi:hypothetical protein
METPILLIVFNRLDTTQQVFERIRAAKPKKLYVASDAPRKDKPGEEALCASVRNFIENSIDWDCSLFTLYQPTNLGCGKGPAAAITWLFENEEQGIILEDDCVPTLSFFDFCEDMLARYKEDEKTMLISGLSFLPASGHTNSDYYFKTLGPIWGWATWRRAWRKFDFHISEKDIPLYSVFADKTMREFFIGTLKAQLNGTVDAWDVQWATTILRNGGQSIVPVMNQITNVGVNGTHSEEASPVHNMPGIEIKAPFTPASKKQSLKYRYINDRMYGLYIDIDNCRGRRYIVKKALLELRLKLLRLRFKLAA